MAGKENSKLKAGFWYLVSSFTLKGVAMLTTPIFTRLLSTEDYGIVATYNMWYETLMVVCSLNLSSGIGRAKQDFKDDFSSYIYSMQYLSILTTLGILLLFIPWHRYLVPVMGLDISLYPLLVIALLFSPIVIFRQIEYKYEYNYKGNIAISVFVAIGTVVFSVLFIMVFDSRRYFGRILGLIVSNLILACFFWFKSIANKANRILFYAWKYALKISVPLIIHTLSQRILSQSDQTMITLYCGASYTGIYSLAVQFTLLFTITIDSVERVWRPWFYENMETRREDILNYTKRLVGVGCYIALLTVIITPEVMKILGTKEYQEGVYVVPLIIFGLLCQYMSTHYISVELYLKKSIYISSCTVVAAIFNVCLNRLFIPMFGYMAAAYTTLISYLLLVVLHACIVKFVIRKNIFDNKAHITDVLITGLLMIIVVMLYDFFIYRLLVGMSLTAIMVYKNKEILKNAKAMRNKSE